LAHVLAHQIGTPKIMNNAIFLFLCLHLHGSLGKTGKIVLMCVVWALIILMSAFLYWFTFVLLDGMWPIQILLGVAFGAALLAAVGIGLIQLQINMIASGSALEEYSSTEVDEKQQIKSRKKLGKILEAHRQSHNSGRCSKVNTFDNK
jgi:TM2 domain-containing membrane protein YozV